MRERGRLGTTEGVGSNILFCSSGRFETRFLESQNIALASLIPAVHELLPDAVVSPAGIGKGCAFQTCGVA